MRSKGGVRHPTLVFFSSTGSGVHHAGVGEGALSLPCQDSCQVSRGHTAAVVTCNHPWDK